MIYDVVIGGITYKVELMEGSPKLNGEETLGLIDYDRQEIFISSEQHAETRLVSILHEILHGIIHDRHIPTGGYEEVIVDGIARGIYQIINDNKELTKEFISKI